MLLIVAALWIYRRNWPFGLSPCVVFLLFIFAAHFVARCGIFTFIFGEEVAGDWLLVAFQAWFLAFALLTEFLLKGRIRLYKKLDSPTRAVEESQWRKTRKKTVRQLSAILLFLAMCGSIRVILLAVEFGLGSAIADAGTFHSYRLSEAAGGLKLSLLGQIFLDGAQSFALFYGIYNFRLLGRGLKLFTACYFVLFLALTAIFGGRAQLAYGAIPAVLAWLATRPIDYAKVVKYGLFLAVPVVLVALVGTFRRMSYLGEEASFALFGYFGITYCSLPEALLVTRTGIGLTNLLTYLGTPFINFNTIVVNLANMQESGGMQSIRGFNAALGLASPQTSSEQIFAFLSNQETLLSLYPAGPQWPFTYGYLLLDFKYLGAFVYIAVLAIVMSSFSIYCRRQGFLLFRYEILLILYYAGFTGYIMPITALHQGLFAAMLLCLLMWLSKESSKRKERLTRFPEVVSG